MDTLKILKKFVLNGKVISCENLKIGNINQTYIVQTDGKTKYLLQKINRTVFKNPRKIMCNVKFILDNLNKTKVFQKNLDLIKTVADNNYFIDENGDFWRCYTYVEDSITYDNTNNDKIIYETGKAYGKFQNAFKNFASDKLYITIENFHNTEKRFEDLIESAKCAGERLKNARNEYEFLLSLKDECLILRNLEKSNKLIHRVTHNDTKCNNVLIDKHTKTAIMVIDFDTVMPGLVAHDFGDGARSIASSVDENEKDFNKVYFNLDKFNLFAKGFIGEVSEFLTEQEKLSLNESIKIITCELAVRFLTDYFIRDKYFRIEYPEHNLMRAKNQIALLNDVIKKQADIKKVISACFK